MAARVLRLPAAEVSHANVMIALYDLTGVKQSERMRADFVANVSHELRTQLTSLIGFIETLRGPARADAVAQARFLEIMEAQDWNSVVEGTSVSGRVEIGGTSIVKK